MNNMQIQISTEIDKKLKQVSDISGFSEKDIIERAILFYLDTIQKQMQLKSEFKEWDMLSDEALENFENIL
ncbi:MAG: hypothetical protein FVQ77_00745 [Cytophagales bacterium]|nr:hypothetical protein [Cytophagales bacterium]